MPFSNKYDDTFIVGITPAVLENNLSAKRVDYEEFTGDIVAEIHNQISTSSGVIADISESNPNVLYEIGFALGLNKKIIQVCRSDFNRIPFNIRNNHTVKYAEGQIHLLASKLSKKIGNIINN